MTFMYAGTDLVVQHLSVLRNLMVVGSKGMPLLAGQNLVSLFVVEKPARWASGPLVDATLSRGVALQPLWCFLVLS
jgi:hypothetical protein